MISILIAILLTLPYSKEGGGTYKTFLDVWKHQRVYFLILLVAISVTVYLYTWQILGIEGEVNFLSVNPGITADFCVVSMVIIGGVLYLLSKLVKKANKEISDSYKNDK